jgi:hypothetical protein
MRDMAIGYCGSLESLSSMQGVSIDELHYYGGKYSGCRGPGENPTFNES